MTPRGVGGWGTQCPLSLPHPARAPPVPLPQAQPQSTRSVRGRGWLRPRRRRPGLPESWPLPPARQAPGPPPRTPREHGGGRGSQGTDRREEPPRPGLARPAPLAPSGAGSGSPPLTHPPGPAPPPPPPPPPPSSRPWLLLRLYAATVAVAASRAAAAEPPERARTQHAGPAPKLRPAPSSRRRQGFGPAFPAAFRSPLKGDAQEGGGSAKNAAGEEWGASAFSLGWVGGGGEGSRKRNEKRFEDSGGEEFWREYDKY
ncbi:basic proline-rich protein-like [Cervus elaphus]|uniref:basic proline-rich protein-like n=1 Tax=Cervus elaphus TaxID=9860 RepID=UPI001CC2F8DF|nr:basic proline-rich protein-like [Cervus elaphus]